MPATPFIGTVYGDFFRLSIPKYTKQNPAPKTQDFASFVLYSIFVGIYILFSYPCLFWTQFPCGSTHAITTESIYLHPLLNAFIGLLPRFIFFVKVPSWRRIENHRSVPPLTKFLKFCRLPSVGTYVYVGVSPSFVSFREVTTIIVVYLLFAYFPFLSFHGHAFRVFAGLSLQPLRAFTRWRLGYFF